MTDHACCQHRKTNPDPRPLQEEILYTCPMHPQVRQVGPGNCPICGMALEPEDGGVGDEANHEYQSMRRRFQWAFLFSLPVVVLAMGPHFVGDFIPWSLNQWLQLGFASPVVFVCGWPFFQRAWASLFTRLNMFSLIALGTAIAWGFSLVAVLFPALFPLTMAADGGNLPIYFEAAAVITTLVLLGQVLELRARAQTGGAIRALLDLSPALAHRLINDQDFDTIPLAAVQVGERLQVLPGEKVPLDGKIVKGQSVVDESMITGESYPQRRQVGDQVIGGTLNQTGSFVMEVEKVGKDTVLSQIVQMVAAAQRSQAPVQRLVDHVSGWFVPFVIVIACLAFLGWMFFGPAPQLSHALVAAVSVLIIACPCALGLATPVSIMVGVGQCARAGILVKDAKALEQMETIDTLVVDKTGTLTAGKPSVTHIEPMAGYTSSRLIQLAASLERLSEHPLAQAILAAAVDMDQALLPAENFESFPGKGISGVIDGQRLSLGKPAWLSEQGLSLLDWQERIKVWATAGATVTGIAVDGNLAGFLLIQDPIKPNTAAALAALRQQGIDLIMLTGDSQHTAKAVAHSLGIQQVIAEVLPQDKAQVIADLQSKGKKVAMAGDGVNDAPALAQANVGIAMATGTDVAIESADLTLLHGDLQGIVLARRLARATMHNIRQNLFFAFVYNAMGIPLAAGLFYPMTGWLLNPMVAAAAMSLSSVSVIANALRLRWL